MMIGRKRKKRMHVEPPVISTGIPHVSAAQCEGWLFINANPRVPPIHTNSARAHVRCTRAVRTLNGCDSIPSGGSAGAGDGEDIDEGNAGRRVASLGKRGMTPNVRPDREIRHTSDAPLRYPPPCPCSNWR